MITIFTPTYNRAHTLPRLYKSLCSQTVIDFEWLVIDDGSVDNTENLISEWKKESPFPIVYIKQQHGGKHRAINRALDLAKGEAFLFLDSDDYLVADGIYFLHNWFESIRDIEGICAVLGRKGYSVYNPIGGYGDFAGEYIDLVHFGGILQQYGVNCDAAGMYKTEVLKKFKFPEYEGEFFCPENVQLVKIAFDGYKERWYHKILQICEYRNDGLTARGMQLHFCNPKGYLDYLLLEYNSNSITKEKYVSKKFMLYCYFLYNKSAQGYDLFSSEEISIFFAWQKSIVKSMREFFTEKNINKIAIYGLGVASEYFRVFLAQCQVDIVVGIDQNHKNIDALKTIRLKDIMDVREDLVGVDACIITMQQSDEVAYDNCSRIFSDVYYWHDILANKWNLIWGE